MQAPCLEHNQAGIGIGYGATKVGGKSVRTHRLAYFQHHGVTLESIEGMQVLHSCDNARCIEPTHLRLGTHADNMQDKVDRDRNKRGEQHGRAVLTAEQVAQIRVDSRPQRDVAAAFGVSQSAISRIKRGALWRKD